MEISRNCFLVSICFLVSSVTAFGQETKPLVPENTFEIGLNVNLFEYEEPALMKEDGLMYGLIGSYTYLWVSKRSQLQRQ